jgi:hypothetical protein
MLIALLHGNVMESVRRFHEFCHFGNVAKLPGVEHGPHDTASD